MNDTNGARTQGQARARNWLEARWRAAVRLLRDPYNPWGRLLALLLIGLSWLLILGAVQLLRSP